MQITVLNGAQRGVPGGGINGGGTAKESASMAIMYDPEGPMGSRISTLASSGVHRCALGVMAPADFCYNAKEFGTWVAARWISPA